MHENWEYLVNLAIDGTPAQKRELFGFNSETSEDEIVIKFQLFAKSNFIRYFPDKDAPFHPRMIRHTIRSYRGENATDVGFRGDAKTTLRKLLRVYLLLNDTDHFRKYLKILCRDDANSKQIVTDIYNLMLELAPIYGDVFNNESKQKKEETMSSFTLGCGVKVKAGTVGQKQRGHIQDAYRPDWIWFEDIEDRESVSSQVITQKVIVLCDEAITGLARNGSWELTGNYISDTGSVQWFLDKPNTLKISTPILSEYRVENGKLVSGIPAWPIYTFEQIQQLEKTALDFWGDYMCDPNRSKNKFFDIERIERDMKECKAPLRTSGEVKYFGNYLPHHRYGQGSDHSEGLGEDANANAIFDFTTGELVASYANNEIAPDLATHEFARVGAEYGNCLWAPEVNNKCGGIVLATSLQISYPRLFEQRKIKGDKEEETGKFGWETNSKTKYTMFFDFKRDYNDGLIKIYDIEVLKEMKAYGNSDLQENTTGLITRHFDLLTAVVIAWQMRKYAEAVQADEEDTARIERNRMNRLSTSRNVGM
jgi:hypothetical protein